jgi:hypothetical protein
MSNMMASAAKEMAAAITALGDAADGAISLHVAPSAPGEGRTIVAILEFEDGATLQTQFEHVEAIEPDDAAELHKLERRFGAELFRERLDLLVRQQMDRQRHGRP